MTITGIIAEYNPLHKGHQHHLEQARITTNATHIVCIMSGNFVQRGLPAVINKWARTKNALMNGADLVIELPVVYAVSSSEYFAHGAISILQSMNLVDNLCFGSECNDIKLLTETADILLNETKTFKIELKNALEKGIKYNTAVIQVLAKLYPKYVPVLNGSNNILAVDYIKALKQFNSSITPISIKRVGTSYNSLNTNFKIISATAIRNAILAGDISKAKNGLTEKSYTTLENEIKNQRYIYGLKNYEQMLLYRLRSLSPKEIKSYPYMETGFENRLAETAKKACSYSELITLLSTKRYPNSRINRILVNILLGIDKNSFDEFNNNNYSQYMRVLGFNSKGKELFAHLKAKSQLPLIVQPSQCKLNDYPLARKMFAIEKLATDTYVLGYDNKDFRVADQDYTNQIIKT